MPAESDRLTTGCGGVLNGCEQERTVDWLPGLEPRLYLTNWKRYVIFSLIRKAPKTVALGSRKRN